MDTPEKTKTVLVIEDDSFLAKAYEIKLKKEGINARLIMNGKDALACLSEEPPAVVLLDLMLPGLSGFDFLTKLREVPAWKDVPVMILTNLGQAQDIERGRQLGAVDYIIKANVKISEVIEKVRRYV
jgi:DNA-binding response OmpR family regulator